MCVCVCVCVCVCACVRERERERETEREREREREGGGNNEVRSDALFLGNQPDLSQVELPLSDDPSAVHHVFAWTSCHTELILRQGERNGDKWERG